MDKKKTGIILSILGILGLVVITAGVTYAFFNYAKEGTTDNVITTGSITFLYTEVSGVGNGISIENAFPISDEVGKVATGEGEYFDFKITSDTFDETSIPYEVTARKKADSTLDEEAVRIYLTDQDTGDELLLDNYSNLTQTSKVESTKYIEKTIYTDRVPANTEDYEKNFRLRMWIDENIDFSQNEDGTYPYNGKTFTITVNVYANAKVITADEEELLQNANISSVSIDGTELTQVENQDYNYEMTLPVGTTETELDIVTENEYATVSVEKIDSLTYSNNIKRLSAKKTVDVVSGDNYFKVTVTSENKEVIKEYKLKITVLKDTDNTLKSLNLTDCQLNEEFSSDVTSYTCTVQNNVDKTTVSAEATSSLATVAGTGEQSLVTGDNTITVTVTSESGEEKTYTITVTKPEIKETVTLFNKTFEVISATPTLTAASNKTSDASGLYKSTKTNDGNPTYYFRGNVTNNYVDFAGFTWRVVRINEDGTIRLIMSEGINNNTGYKYNTGYTKLYMYYTYGNNVNGSNARYQLENWYTTNIEDKGFSTNIVTGDYYCEQAKIAYGDGAISNSGAAMITYSSYNEPDFKCEPDANGYGLLNASVGLITYDEVLHAGGYWNTSNNSYYLYSGKTYWTMSTAGFASYPEYWRVTSSGVVDNDRSVTSYHILRPVINLKADVEVTGTGASDDHWIVQ